MHDSPWLRGQYAPVDDELSIAALRVTGALPEGLRGAFLRNGPNPQFPPIGRYHLFDGDGMIHGVTFDGEGGASYANRWVRSAGFEAERAAGRALFGGLSEFAMPPDDIFARVGPIKNTANTHIVSHAGHLLALMEGLGPIEVADDLTTIGPFDFDGRLAGSMTAHPKTDPVTVLARRPVPSGAQQRSIGRAHVVDRCRVARPGDDARLRRHRVPGRHLRPPRRV